MLRVTKHATLLKKRLWHRCFPVDFAKFLRTPFLQNTLRDCFCAYTFLVFNKSTHCFKLQNPILKHLVKKKNEDFLPRTACLSFTDFQMENFATNLNLLRPCLKIYDPRLSSFSMLYFTTSNLGRMIVDKFAKLSNIGFLMECFIDEFLRFFGTNAKICQRPAEHWPSDPSISQIFLKFPNFRRP